MLDLHLLTVDGQPSAFFYGYHTNGRTFGLRMGYDPSAPKGCGAVLFGRVIERSFDLGDKLIDLGSGAESYKTRFRTGVETTTRLSHIPTTAWRPRAISFARRFWKQLNAPA